MILNLIALVFVLGITFLHSMFGLYSGLINVFCSVTALAVAFGFYEPLNDFVTAQLPVPSFYVEPAALVLLFVVTLIILRSLADQFLRGNVRVPMYLDWAGGAACGFVNAQICVGVMVLGFLMLPWGGGVAGFWRYARAEDNRTDADGRAEFVRHNLWLGSDAFAVGLFNLLSQGSLRSGTSFASVYPDFAEWVFWTGNTIQPESFPSPLRDKDGDGYKNGIKLEKWWEQKARLDKETTRYRPLAPTRDNPKPPYDARDYNVRANHRLVGFRLALLRAAADRAKGNFYHRFRPSQFRLVGDVEMPDGSLEPRHYVPQVIGGADPVLETNLRIVDIDANFSLPAAGETRVDLYFEVPESFKPRFVEYRRHARVAVRGGPDKTPPADRLAAAGGPTPAAGPDKATGAARFIDAVNRQMTGDRDDLPFAMSADRVRANLECELSGNLLLSGRLTGDRATLAAGRGDKDAVAKLKPPEGMRIFQLATKPHKAASLPGQAMNFAGSVVNQYRALDDTGRDYPLAGYYALIKRDGQEFLELFFTPDPEGSGFRGMLDFKTEGIRKALQDQPDAVLGLIFIVPPGKSIVAVTSQGGKVEFGESFPVGGK